MSAFSFDVRRESFAKTQNRFADCFIRQIVPESLRSRFIGSATFYGISFNLLKLTIITYYYSVLHVSKILCLKDRRPNKGGSRYSDLLDKTNFLMFSCEIRSRSVVLRHFSVSEVA